MKYLMILLVTVMTVGSQILLKKAIIDLANFLENSKLSFLIAAAQSPYVIGAVAMQGIGFVLWIFVLTKMKLGLAFAFSGAFFYILIALSGYYIYGEELSIQQWVGLVIISLGVVIINMA
jgi:multidrug transporter EmrE-like cation transporter